MKYSGVLFRVNAASDSPVSGTRGKKLIVPREAVTEESLQSLIGKPLTATLCLSQHYGAQVGVITEAWIEDDDVCISGDIVATLPRRVLGLSFDAHNVHVEDMRANPLRVCEPIEFAGAAVLLRSCAAFRSYTSFAEQAAAGGAA